jgi:hypothetical protein
MTGVGGKLEGADKTNGIVSLYCNGYLLKQEGCFTRIRRGGGDTLAIVTNKKLAFSTDRARSLNGYGRRQMMLRQCGVFRNLALSCRLGC